MESVCGIVRVSFTACIQVEFRRLFFWDALNRISTPTHELDLRPKYFYNLGNATMCGPQC